MRFPEEVTDVRRSVQRFYLLLAESLPESERKRFLDTVAPASPSRERR